MEVGFAAWDTIDTGMMIVTLGGSAALTTLLKQGAKQGAKQGLETAAKNSGKQLTKKFGQEMAARLSKTTGKNLGKNTQKVMLKAWTQTQFLQKMRGLLLKQTAQKTTKQTGKQALVEITPMARFMFKNLGVSRTSMKRMTKLEARLFMRSDARVAVTLDKAQASKAINRYLTDTAQNTAIVSAQEPLESWSRNAFAWWALNVVEP